MIKMVYLAIVFKVCFQNVFNVSRVRSLYPILERSNESVSFLLGSKISLEMVNYEEVDNQIENGATNSIVFFSYNFWSENEV